MPSIPLSPFVTSKRSTGVSPAKLFRIRQYPHFDADISISEAQRVATDPVAVARHAFFPFIETTERWTRFAQKGISGKEKSRPLRKAARLDACIYTHYRSILVAAYEAELRKLGIEENVLAYRRIRIVHGKGHKCNIHFANDAFQRIQSLDDCIVYALDIKSFFDSIDHAKLKAVWEHILSVDRLPPDHYKIYKSVTRYAWVNKNDIYEKLGFIGPKTAPNGRPTVGYRIGKVPLQVCSAAVFREQIAPLIAVNKEPHGIPQGSPISDVLANLYLLEFDAKIAKQIQSVGGSYYRYSDDILIIVPDVSEDHNARILQVQKLLNDCGEKLMIQPQKTCVFRFSKADASLATKQLCTLIDGAAGKNGLEYLGFRFDGARVYLRDSTLSNLNRKMVSSARRLARRHCGHNPGASIASLEATFNYNLLLRQFGRVQDFESKFLEYKNWTFWTYAKRAASVFGNCGNPILHQLKRYKQFARRKADEALSACSH